MYLKNIEVHGFKSFAQKINFEFHNGITGIVGPNGCGKSNVADAVRWVLGEQSARQLRGGNMQDVIFSGTETRKPLSFASVAITLDNSDHKLPVDFNEVTVTRRLYRSGESEYLINGSICRLRDINEMFYDTGIGKEGYSIIGQGQIDKILSGKPEDRRELFDEAAGIVKFKRRKNMTLKKLEEEQQNLVRVSDILSELEKQLGPLKKQSETAKLYLARRDELKVLDVNLFLEEHEYNGKLLKELLQKLDTAGSQLSEAKGEYEKTKEDYDRLELELESLNRKLEELREEREKKSLKKQELEGQVNVLNEQILSGDQNQKHFRERLDAIETDRKRYEEEAGEFREEADGLKGDLRRERKKIQEEEERLSNLQKSILQCTEAVEEGKNEIIELLNSRANTKGQAQRFAALMEQADIQKAEISQQVLKLMGEEEQQKEDYSKARETYEAVSDRIRRMNQECGRLDGEIQKIQEELKKQNAQMEIGQTAYHREASRLESLKNLAERYDGFGNAIRRVMEQKDRNPGIHGVVADLLQVQKQYEVAIETALGGSIQNIVTDTDQTAKNMIEFLKRNRFGRATFLPLQSLSIKGDFQQKDALNEPGAIGTADRLVETEETYHGLVRYLLGRILVVDHIDHAIAIARKYRHSFRMVTLEGESLNPGGSMTGGAFKNTSNLLGRKREIEELEGSVKALKTDMEAMQRSIDENRSRRNVMRDTIADLKDKLRKQYVEQNTAGLLLESLKEKEKEIGARLLEVKRSQEELDRKTDEIQADREKTARELKASEKDERELETYIDTRQKELDELKEEEAQLQEKLSEERMNSVSLSERESYLSENLKRCETELQLLEEEKEEILEKLDAGGTEKDRKQQEIREIRETILHFQEEEAEDRERLSRLQAEKEEKNQSHRQFFEIRDKLSGEIGLLDKECFRLNSLKERIDEKREAQISYLWDEYEITPGHAEEFRREGLGNRQEIKKKVGQLRDEIRKLGSVNVNAIEDYKNVQDRYTFLMGQFEDLKKAEETMRNIIQELDDGMRKQFTEKFREIQLEFDKAFRDLFGGGKGTLELQEEDDILDAGIRIISQPPGKKLQNMMQLSGGEKALTAIALLFAIQNLKPSPFCLLDEIEAALDDSNVGRFASYLQKLTKNTQFIVITHRRGTMNAADRLYGITMQEKGVSALVSVDLVENQLT